MILTDLNFILTWWLLFFILGTIFLPLTFLIFRDFIDKGYAFTKIIGILGLSYSVWLLGSLKIVPQTSQNILIIIVIFLLLNLWLLKKVNLFYLIKTNWKIFVLEEVIFTAGLIFWSFIKAHEPSIHGLEKFMDYGFINSILRADHFPPPDLWMSGETINYYYFGHLIASILTKLSFLDSNFTFNLMLCSLFALTLSASFSIGVNLYSKITQNLKLILFAGFFTAALVTLSGNLHTIYVFLDPSYWYANATRFIPYTIHEFPLYSFVVSDLHGHVLNIPLVLFIIALLITIFYQNKISKFYLLLLGLAIAMATMTNVLDGPIYLMLTAILLIIKKVPKYSIILGFIILAAVAFSLPFWISFKPFSSGIGLNCAPIFLTDIGRIALFIFEKDHCQRSPIWMLFIVYGFFLTVFLSFIIRFKTFKNLAKENLLIIAFIIFSTAAIIIPEFFYIKDIYPAHFRANTVFKFGYQAFIVSSIATSFIILRLISSSFTRYLLPFYILIISMVFLISIYPYFAVNSYFNSLQNYQGLDGIKYLQNLYPTDYQAILWIKQNIKDTPVILEAVGDSYTDYARVSSNTGLPTVLGWPVHEWLWRNTVDEIDKRREDVAKLYESSDINETKDLVNKYNISYVFIGELEKEKYPDLNLDKFYQLGTTIFQQGETFIFKIR